MSQSENLQRFGDPSRMKWENTFSYFKGRDAFIDQNHMDAAIGVLQNYLFPSSAENLLPEEVSWRETLRAKYKIDSPEDARIPYMARFFWNAAYASIKTADLLGRESHITMPGEEASQEASIESTILFSDSVRAPGFTQILFQNKDGVQISRKDITQENVHDVSVGKVLIAFNMTYFLEEWSKNQVLLPRHLAGVPLSRQAELRRVAEEKMLNEAEAAYAASGVEEIVHAEEFLDRAKTPEGIISLAEDQDVQALDDYLKARNEIAVKGWTKEYLRRYYPNSQTAKQVTEHYRRQELYLQSLSSQSERGIRREQRGSGKKKKKK